MHDNDNDNSENPSTQPTALPSPTHQPPDLPPQPQAGWAAGQHLGVEESAETKESLDLTTAVREALADYAHEAWSGWMRYMLPLLQPLLQYDLDSLQIMTLPGEKQRAYEHIRRWRRQMQTAYPDLPEKEQLSDLAEADRILQTISEVAQAQRQVPGFLTVVPRVVLVNVPTPSQDG
jgi:hypothetical protein